jgi:hypothetical protein
MPAEPVPVTPPNHPLPALTSYELRDYRRQSGKSGDQDQKRITW